MTVTTGATSSFYGERFVRRHGDDQPQTHASGVARAVGESRYAPATANKHLAALRGALKAAWRMDVSPSSRPCLPPAGPDDSPAGVRDTAVIDLSYPSGTRRAELVALHLVDDLAL